MSEPIPIWLLVPLLFVPSFIALWLFVTSLLAWVSGWFRLQAQFPDRDATVLATLGFQSGQMGVVGYRGCLHFDVCTTGLRTRVWKPLAPFSRPFFVPWQEIRVERKRRFLFDWFRMGFGLSEQGSLSVRSRTATELVRLSGGLLKTPSPAP